MVQDFIPRINGLKLNVDNTQDMIKKTAKN